MSDTKKQDDDLPEGLRQSSSVNYFPGKPHHDVPAPVKAAITAPAKNVNVISREEQTKRDEDAIKIWQEELYKARDKLAAGDERARGDIHALEAQIQRATGEKPSQSAVVNTEESKDSSESDLAPSLKSASVVKYETPKPVKNPSTISDKTIAELGIGAAAGAYSGYRQRKSAAATQAEQFSNLPLDMRPVDVASLQRYINSQLSVKIPLKDLEKLTGMEIRTPKEVQAAIRVIQGSEMDRTPVVKDVDGRKTVVSYRINPAQAPIDISMYQPQSNSFFSKLGNALSDKAKSATGNSMNYLRPIVGGMVAAPQLMEAGSNYFQNKPVDPTQVLSGIGGLGMMAKSAPIGAACLAAQLPYAIKHREEIARNMKMSDVVDPVMSMFLTGQEMFEPVLPGMQPQEAGAGRGFVNPPSALP